MWVGQSVPEPPPANTPFLGIKVEPFGCGLRESAATQFMDVVRRTNPSLQCMLHACTAYHVERTQGRYPDLSVMFVTISGAEDELRDAVAAATARLPVEEPGPHARPLPTASKCFAEWRSTLPWFAGETLRNFLSLGENERGSMVYDILCAEAWRTPAARALFDVGVLRWRLPIPVERMPWVLQDNPSPDKWPAMHACIVRNTSVPLHKVMSPLVQVASGDAYAYSSEADVGAAFWESVRYGQAGLLRRMLMVDLLTMTPDDVNEVYVAVGAALAGAPGFVPQAYRAIMRTGGTTLDQATRVAMMALRQCGMAAGLRPWSSMVEHCVAQCGATNAGWTSGIICLMLAPLLACSTANHVWHLGGPRSGGKSTIIAMMGDMLEAAKTVSAAGTPLAMIYDGQVLDNGEQRVHTGTGCMVPCDEDGPTTSSDRRASNLWKTAITEECVSRKHTAEAADGSRKAITSLNGIWGASICVTSNQPSSPDLNTRVDVIQFHDSVPRGSGQLTMSRPTLQAMASIHESVRRILLPAVATAGALCADTALVKAAVTAADAGAVPRVHTRGEEIARCVATVNLAVLVVLHFKPSAWPMSDLAMLLLLEPPQPHDAVLLDNIAPSCDGAAFAQSIGHHLAAVVVPVSTGRLQYAAFNGDCQTLTAQQQRVLPGIFASVDHLTRERTPRELGQRMLASGVLAVTADDIASANIRYVAASVPRERVRLAVVLAGQLLDLVHSVPSAFVLVDKTVLVLSTEWLRAMSLCADDETTTALKELMKRRQLSAALRQMHANFHAGFWVSLVHMGMCVAGITHETDDVPDNVVQAVGAPRARQNFGGRLGEGDHCLFKPTSLSSAAWIDMRQLEKATHQYNYNTPPMVAVLQNTPTLVPAYDVSLAGHVHHIVPRPLRGRAVIDKRLPRAEVPLATYSIEADIISGVPPGVVLEIMRLCAARPPHLRGVTDHFGQLLCAINPERHAECTEWQRIPQDDIDAIRAGLSTIVLRGLAALLRAMTVRPDVPCVVPIAGILIRVTRAMDDETQSLYARAMGELSTRHTDVAFAAHAETALQPFADAVFPGLSASARAAWVKHMSDAVRLPDVDDDWITGVTGW